MKWHSYTWVSGGFVNASITDTLHKSHGSHDNDETSLHHSLISGTISRAWQNSFAGRYWTVTLRQSDYLKKTPAVPQRRRRAIAWSVNFGYRRRSENWLRSTRQRSDTCGGKVIHYSLQTYDGVWRMLKFGEHFSTVTPYFWTPCTRGGAEAGYWPPLDEKKVTDISQSSMATSFSLGRISKTPFTRYNGCQTGCITGLTTGCIV